MRNLPRSREAGNFVEVMAHDDDEATTRDSDAADPHINSLIVVHNMLARLGALFLLAGVASAAIVDKRAAPGE